MSDLDVTIEPERITTSALILRPWSLEDAGEAFEIYGDPATAAAIGMRGPVADIVDMRRRLARWSHQSSNSPVPQGLWAVESVADGRLIGGATLLPFGVEDPALVMGWHLRPDSRGLGVAGQIGHALAHQAFAAGDVTEVFVAAGADNNASIRVARRLGMTVVAGVDWVRDGVRLEVLRLARGDLHSIRPGISLDGSYDPEGLGDW